MAKKILIVDDEKNVIELLAAYLKGEGYEVKEVGDGQAAVASVHAERPDLIILDVMLPKLDGYQVCRLLKFDENFKTIPIIMFTSRAEAEDVKTGGEVGADAYIPKPFDVKVMGKKIKELLG